jgi:hypothetical protein
VLQAIPQSVPLQVGLPCGSVGQAVQEVPQLLGLVLDRHSLPHLWYPVASQEMPQLKGDPLQVDEPWGVVGQAVHEFPQPLTLLLATQVSPQR